MKKYITIPIVILALLSSCQDYLEFPPEGEIPQDQFFSSQEDAQKAVNAMYGYLRSLEHLCLQLPHSGIASFR